MIAAVRCGFRQRLGFAERLRKRGLFFASFMLPCGFHALCARSEHAARQKANMKISGIDRVLIPPTKVPQEQGIRI